MVIVLVSVVTLVLGSAGIFVYTSYSNLRWSKLRTDLKMESDQLVLGLTLAVWNIDRDQIDKIIESEMNDRNIYGIEVTAAGRIHSRVRDMQWNVVEGRRSEDMNGLIAEERSITFSGEQIGNVKVLGTGMFVTQDLRNSFLSIITIIVTLDILLSFGLYLMLWRIVLKPLQEVERYALAVSSGVGIGDIEGGRRFHGELEGLRSSIEKMVLLLEERYMQLQEEAERQRASEARFRTLIEQAPVAISISRDGRVLYTNSMYGSLFGIQDVEESRGKLMFSYFSVASREEALERSRQRAAGLPAPDQYEAVGVRSDGSEFPIHVAVSQVPLADGPAYIAFITDITERKRAEDGLRESEARYRALIENMPNGIVISQEDKLVYVNPAAVAILGIRSDQDIFGRSIEQFVDEEYSDRLRIRRDRVMETGEAASIQEYKVKRSDGTSVEVEGQGVRIVLDGKPSLMNSFRDISARKRAEAALTNSMEQLHLLAAKLENIREEERRFISHEVHDELGQVLTALKLDIAFLRKTGFGNQAMFDEKMMSMLTLADSAIKTVQNISSKLRPGMLDDLGLVAAVEWATEDFQKRAGISCSLKLPETELDLDEKRSTVLFRILQEGLTNVARHAQAKHIDVTLSDSVSEVTLTILDDGVGIREEQIQSTRSIGLLGIRERLHPFRGICTIKRRAQGGTELAIRIPKESPS